MSRKRLLDAVSNRIGRRSLVWLGVRGADASALTGIPQLAHVFSATAPLGPLPPVSEFCLETARKRRFNMHTYELGSDRSPEAGEMHRELFTALLKPSVVMAYRPDEFLAAAYFPQAGRALHLGMFHGLLAAFEDKTWVESELRKAGVNILPWRYYGQHRKPDILRLLRRGPVVFRSGVSGSSHGGANLSILREPGRIDFSRYGRNAVFAVSRYLEPSIPLNINACLFRDGSISLHGPSVQLIGLAPCTGYQLGYCGNDFAQVRHLDEKLLEGLETLTLQTGKWLSGRGYVGVFGLDAVLHRDRVFLAEINPRFQGSSLMSARLDAEMERPDVFLNHMAAFLDLPAPSYVPLKELVRQQRKMSQVFCYNRNPRSVFRGDMINDMQSGVSLDQIPERDVEVEPEGMLFRAVTEGRVTDDGHSLLPDCEKRISDTAQRFLPRESFSEPGVIDGPANAVK